jgi:manganese efflux pump family protein
MSFVRLILLSTALGTDLFSVTLGLGMNRVRLRQILKASVCFALAHIFLLLTGYNLGHLLGYFIEHIGTHHNPFSTDMVQNWAGILGAVVLILLGINMIWENVKREDESIKPQGLNPLQGVNLLILAISVSLDAMAVGFGLGMLDVDLVVLCAVLGVVIFIIAVIGLLLGRKLGVIIGHRAELVGGLVLILMGINVLL